MSKEILSIINSICEEKNINKNIVTDALEYAFADMAKDFYVSKKTIAKTKTGTAEIEIFEELIVSEEEGVNLISIEDALKINKSAKLGSIILKKLPQPYLTSSSIMKIKNTVLSSIKNAEKNKEYEQFLTKENKLIEGKVKKISVDHIVVGVKKIGDAILFKNQTLPSDFYEIGDNILALVTKVTQSDKFYQATLSRTSSKFLEAILEYYIPEMKDIIRIEASARFPGVKSKIAVRSEDPRIDPVGVCIGQKGSKIKEVIQELKGEKIDVIRWDANINNFTKNAIYPLRVYYINLTEDGFGVDVVVDEEDLSLGIGSSGKNIKLVSRLIGKNVNLVTKAEYDQVKKEEKSSKISSLMKEIDIDESVATVLFDYGFTNCAIIANADVSKLTSIDIFEPEMVQEIKNRAIDTMEIKTKEIKRKIEELKIEEDFLNLEGMKVDIAISLALKGIKTVQDLANMSTDELEEIASDFISENLRNRLILAARSNLY